MGRVIKFLYRFFIILIMCNVIFINCEISPMRLDIEDITTLDAEWDYLVEVDSPQIIANAQFGQSVDVCGDYIIVGMPGNNRADIFKWDDGEWDNVATLNGVAGDFFGWSVAITDSYAVVGAPMYNGSQGRAYFYSSSTNWAQDGGTVTQGNANDYFGWSVDIDGTYAIIGAINADYGASTGCGLAYIYERNINWDPISPILKKTTQADTDDFGYSVAIDGDTAIVGDPLDDVAANNDAGSVFIFVRSTSGGVHWGTSSGFENAKLNADPVLANIEFGTSISISGKFILIGAPEQGGAIYFFEGSKASWSQDIKITPSGNQSGDLFGYSVSIYNTCALAGAYLDDDKGVDSGSVYFFKYKLGSWQAEKKPMDKAVLAPDGLAGDWFGISVNLTDEYAIIGANYVDVGATNHVGSVYTYKRD